MATSPPVPDSRKRPRASVFSAESLCLDFGDGVYPSCNKRMGLEIIQRKVSPSSSASSSSMQPACVSSSSAIPFAKEDIGSSSPRNHESSGPASSSASAITDTADSTTGSALLCALPHECSPEQQLLCCASSDQEAESCCGGNDTSELDISCFLLHEVWDDAGSEGGDAFAFNPETIFLNGGNSTDCSDDAAFADCSAENGNWFLNDLESQGHGFLNEVLDQEWMAAAVANLDRINDTLDADLCVLHLLESDHADKGY